MKEVWLITGMAAVTFGVRYPVLALMGRIEMPAAVKRALRFVPVAVLCALSAPMILVPNGDWFVSPFNPAVGGAVVAGIVAWRTHHLLLTILVGMTVFGLVKLLTSLL